MAIRRLWAETPEERNQPWFQPFAEKPSRTRELTAASAEAGSATSKYVGSWKATDVTLGDESEALGGDFVMTINEDGTGELSGEGETAKFTWTEIGDGFKAKGDVNATFKDDGDNIKARILIADLIFVKQ